jgi:STE24 endopeptidase
MITSTFNFVLIIAMLLSGGFAWLDKQVRTYTTNPVWMAIMFFGALGIASDIIGTPFSIYHTFVIEEKFGFNKTTVKTFILDKVKGYLLAAIIGGGLLALIVWIYGMTGKYFWLYTWGVMAVFMMFATMFYSSIILPLFNKLTPLPQGELRSAIEAYCSKVGFKLNNLFVMDGSKRSSKANAFFSGLGAKKKIVLFDTLINKHSNDELVAVLAHEIGHYKNPSLAEALGAKQSSFHLDILVLGMLYSPLSEILGILMNMLSRKHEYEADNYAKTTFKQPEAASCLRICSLFSSYVITTAGRVTSGD